MPQISVDLKCRIVAIGMLVVAGCMLAGCDATVCSDCDGPTYTDAFRDGVATSNLDTLSTEQSLIVQLQAVPNVSGIGRLEVTTLDSIAVRSPIRDTLSSEETVAVEVRFAEGEPETREIVFDPLLIDDNLSLHPRAIMDSVLVQGNLYGPDASEVRALIPEDILNPEQDLGHLLIEARR